MPMYQDAAQLWSDDSLSGCLVALEKEPTEKGDDDDGDGDHDGDGEREISCWSLPTGVSHYSPLFSVDIQPQLA